MRVNPVLDWGYGEVWEFLRLAPGATWPSLYDQGYTSIGSIHNTHPNEALRRPDGSYAPAYLLQDGKQERAGRLHQSHKPDRLVLPPRSHQPSYGDLGSLQSPSRASSARSDGPTKADW